MSTYVCTSISLPTFQAEISVTGFHVLSKFYLSPTQLEELHLEGFCCLHDCESIEPSHEKTCLMSYANNKGADQPVHPRSLTSAFIVHCLDSIISLDSIAEISRL